MDRTISLKNQKISTQYNSNTLQDFNAAHGAPNLRISKNQNRAVLRVQYILN
jgi:hypothetical protein